ncbi:HAMP domain-containing histidine kinase [Coleofasciculus sp. FACHB-712]|uniref:sensor histidine kinase n=1 Tax=Cyanophyceae TaxID=3028117 RepID=UPI001687FA6A|nr:HAMP domain-containing sensor histidine kinase [Coleofasciculus sp. FACHB-712]MBD1945660.1 HAMP domain-containing histidine kinase [Coleofasciculus sp. FACHB-712]
MNINSIFLISTIPDVGRYPCLVLGGFLFAAITFLILERRQTERRIKQFWEQETNSQLEDKMSEPGKSSNIKLVCLQAVTHDLRTSTMGMLMILRTLQQSSGEKISLSRTTLERMIESNDRTLTLINSVSEKLDSEPRQIPLQCQPLLLQQILESIFIKYQDKLMRNKVNLNNLIINRPLEINADPSQVQKVVEQLLLNAIKHNPPGVKIDLNATVEQGMLRFSITDNGIGMDQKQLLSLFHLYARNLHNPHLTGIGLGSYLCRQIIQAHGGEIGVSSQPKAGTTVWFTLPLAASDVCHK